MRRLTALVITLLLFTAGKSELPRNYIGIDLGSKGTKAMLYYFENGTPEVIGERNINTKLVSSMDGKRFSAAGIEEAASAVKDLISDMKTRAAANNLAKVDVIYIMGSSAVAKAENKDDLVAAVKAVTGVVMSFVEAKAEAYYGLVTAVPGESQASAILVDIGGGNTKMGCVVGEPNLHNFRAAEITLGSVSGRNAALAKHASDYQAALRQVMKEDVRPAFFKQSMDTPCLRNRQLIYWTGGAAWATATFTHPEAALRQFVPLTRKDLSRFRNALADGSWNQKGLVYQFKKNTRAAERKRIKAKAESEKKDVLNIFTREDLMSGLSIMSTVLAESNPSAEIYYSRNNNYIYGYALETYQEK